MSKAVADCAIGRGAMMFELVTNALGGLYDGLRTWSPPPVTMVTVLAFTAISSYVLTGFTAGSRMFTLPISFILLFFAGLFTNFLGRNVHLTGATDMQNAIVLSLVGQVVVGFILLLLFRTETSDGGQR